MLMESKLSRMFKCVVCKTHMENLVLTVPNSALDFPSVGILFSAERTHNYKMHLDLSDNF